MSSLNLKGGHLLTIGAVLFAGFALYETFKKPGGALSTQPGAAARDAGLQSFLNLQDIQWTNAGKGSSEYSIFNIPSNLGGVTP